MHELSLAEDMRNLILQQAQRDSFARVDKVWLEIGELSCVEAQAMMFCFGEVMQGTPAAGASLEIIPVAGRGRCPACGAMTEMNSLYDACSHCGSFGLTVVQGQDVRLKSLSVSGSRKD